MSDTEGLILAGSDPLDRNPAAVYLAGLGSEGSRQTMRGALGTIVRLVGGEAGDLLAFPWGELRFQHVAAIRAKVSGAYSPATANLLLSALRGVLKAACNLGQMTADELFRASQAAKTVKGWREPAGRELGAGEIGALMSVCCSDASPAGARDAAVIGLMAVAGPRRSEVTWLDVTDYDPEEGRLLIRHGKGNKERTVFVDAGAGAALDDWLQVRGEDPGPLFVPIQKGGRIILGQRMTSQAIYNMLARRGEAAKVKRFSPHDLRRTTCSELLDAGVDIAVVQRILGHSSPAITARYDRRPDAVKKAAAAKLHVPYQGRTQSLTKGGMQ